MNDNQLWPFIIVVLPVLIVIFSITWTQSKGAPWVPTPLAKVRGMLEMAGVGPGDVVYDLGCGDGRTIVTAARRYGARAVGIEIDPLRFLWCQLLITVLGLRGRVRIILGDFFNQDLGPADVVTCYLLPITNVKLEQKFMRELRPDARVVSSDFYFPGLRLQRRNDETHLYLYHPLPST